MYLPAHFKEQDHEQLFRVIRQHPLGTLIIQGSQGLSADHLPFLLESAESGQGILKAHVARANPLWQEVLQGNAQALVIFQGSSAYLSPSWYPSKADTHQVVPTYNYVAVHAHGTLTVKDDATWLRGLLARLTRQFETGREVPWKMTDAPAEFIDRMLDNLVGIELEISHLEGKWKMSQNRSDADRNGVVTGLEKEHSPLASATAMEVKRLLSSM
jgi:transcriptional regulator